MMSTRPFDSLAFKVGILVTLPLVLILGLFFAVQYERHRQVEMGLLQQSATSLGQAVQGSLRHAMLAQDLSELQLILDDLGGRGGIKHLYLLDNEGEVRFAPQGEAVGTRLDLRAPGCSDCHRQERPPTQQNSIITIVNGVRVLRTCIPINNEAACTRCHNPAAPLNGVIITDLSMDSVDRHVADDLRTALLLCAGALVAAVALVNLVINRTVVSRLARFTPAIKAFGEEDFAPRVATQGNDEIAGLAGTVNRMAQALQDKAELQQRVRRQADELRLLSQERGHLLERIISAQEEERKRIARELHDEWAQILAALAVNLDQASHTLPGDMKWQRKMLDATHSLALDALKALRRLILDLRPSALDDLGLIPAIRWYAETHMEGSGAQVSFQATGAKRRLTPGIETALFRIAQEAINNVEKHADAKNLAICLHFEAERVLMSVEDDGKGFDVVGMLGQEQGHGFGLLGARERAALVGGALHLTSQPGRGTQVRVEVPVPGDGDGP